MKYMSWHQEIFPFTKKYQFSLLMINISIIIVFLLLWIWKYIETKLIHSWESSFFFLASSLYLYGKDKMSHTITENPRSLQMAARLTLLSEPVLKMFSLIPRYFPFPQPTSATRLPTGCSLKNCAIFGQGLWRVPLKWGAIFSYTSCTCIFSRFWASPIVFGRSEEGGTADGFFMSFCESHWHAKEQLQGIWRIFRSVSEILVCLSNRVVPSSAVSVEVLSAMFDSCSSESPPQLDPLFDVLFVP